MLPMGTIMALCMLLGFILALPLTSVRNTPAFIRKPVGYLVMIAGLWNVFWYAVQHLTQFWGQAALVSGVLMIVTAFYIINETRVPPFLQKIRPLVLILLLACGLLYAITIYRL